MRNGNMSAAGAPVIQLGSTRLARFLPLARLTRVGVNGAATIPAPMRRSPPWITLVTVVRVGRGLLPTAQSLGQGAGPG